MDYFTEEKRYLPRNDGSKPLLSGSTERGGVVREEGCRQSVREERNRNLSEHGATCSSVGWGFFVEDGSLNKMNSPSRM